MGIWSAYFFIKLYLYYRGYIRLDVFLNLLFAAFLIIPVPERLRAYRASAMAKTFLGIVLGLSLLWHDSWLKPPLEAVSFIQRQGMPSSEYIYVFLAGFLSLREIAISALIIFITIITARYIRTGPVAVVLLLLIIPYQLAMRTDTDSIDKYLEAFYNKEAKRAVRFEKIKDPPGFDIVILHVCSLSWDDLRQAGLEKEGNAFFKQFDYLFMNFNSATTYSGPAAIRLLRANCGQQRHGDLYNEAPGGCYLLEELEAEGYRTYFLLNHTGEYGGFAKETLRYGHVKTGAMGIKGLSPYMYMFDDTPVYNDYRALEGWLSARGAGPAALYYNTVSLHEGTHRADEKDWWKKDRKMEYKERVRKLMEDVTGFLGLLKSSGRNYVVMFVPEHGAAIGGSRMQAQGLRDIPLPAITNVPVGVKLIGRGYGDGAKGQQVVSKPASYLSLSFILSEFFKNSPFQKDARPADDIMKDLPGTPFVSDTEGSRIVKRGDGYFLYGKDRTWIKLTEKEN